MLATSDPAQGSVIARHTNLSPFNTGLTYLSYNYLSPNLIRGGNPIPVPPMIPHTKPPLPTLQISSYTTTSWKVSNFSISTPQTLLFYLNPSAKGLPTIKLNTPYLAKLDNSSLGKL